MHSMSRSISTREPAWSGATCGMRAATRGGTRRSSFNSTASFSHSPCGVRAGLPLGDTLRIIANEAQEPVKSEFRKVVESQQLGISVPDACAKLAQRVPATETNFFAIVIEIQAKAGGNLSEAIGNLSKTVRERKKMKGKIGAMSMEAKASAAIIGAVPFVVTGALYAVAPEYISLLFTTNHGRLICAVGMGWMSIGIAMMKKMISFDF